MNNQRPINLNLFTIKFPLPAIVSILHRVSGCVLFLMIPILLGALAFSLSTQENFQTLHDAMASTAGKSLVLLLLAPFIYHFVAGIRHLLMDMNVGVELKSGRMTAILTMLISLILLIMAGIYIW